MNPDVFKAVPGHSRRIGGKPYRRQPNYGSPPFRLGNQGPGQRAVIFRALKAQYLAFSADGFESGQLPAGTDWHPRHRVRQGLETRRQEPLRGRRRLLLSNPDMSRVGGVHRPGIQRRRRPLVMQALDHGAYGSLRRAPRGTIFGGFCHSAGGQTAPGALVPKKALNIKYHISF